MKNSQRVVVSLAAGLAAAVVPQAWAHCSGDAACPSGAELTGAFASLNGAASNSVAVAPAAAGLSLPPAASAVGAPGAFDIRFNFTNAPTAAQQAAFDTSAAFWESVLVGYQSGVTLSGAEIDVTLGNIDGAGGTLGFGGPNGFVTPQAGFVFATDGGGNQTGGITLDTSDFGAAPDINVINHEVAHVLGFGTLFELNGLYVEDSGEFTGVNVVAAYQDEFDSLASFVPIELDGGPGTANGHLDENIIVNAAGNIAGVGLTGITDAFGRDLANELLTGVLGPNPGATFLSNTTVATFADLGFVVSLPNAVPEPGTVLMVLGCGTLVGLRRRRA